MVVLVFLGLAVTFGFVLIFGMLEYRWLLLGRIPKVRIKERVDKKLEINMKN